jgi:tRNA C32,U32 (ribose-2'-O)-methylase TrmJ
MTAVHTPSERMAERFDNVIQRIRALLATLSEGNGTPSRERVEATLTEGYAAALALDGERLRLERRMDEVTAHVAHGANGRVKEMQKVLERLEVTEHDLAELRDLLTRLRTRAAKAA